MTDVVAKIEQTLIRARRGDPRAQYELGWLYQQTAEYFVAYKWLAMAMDGGVAEAIEATEMLEASECVSYAEIRHAYFEIGAWCERGDIVPHDHAAAMRLWETAAAMGHLDARARLRQL